MWYLEVSLDMYDILEVYIYSVNCKPYFSPTCHS